MCIKGNNHQNIAMHHLFRFMTTGTVSNVCFEVYTGRTICTYDHPEIEHGLGDPTLQAQTML